MFFTVTVLGASSVANPAGIPTWEPAIPSDDKDVQPFGPTPVFQSLGHSSMPWKKDDTGYAEALTCTVGGRSYCLGGRDTRSAKIVGNLKPGDTVVHSTGPNQAAQLQLKEAKAQAVLVSKVLSNGKNEKLQITHAGAIVEIDKGGDITLLNGAGAGILLQGKKIFLNGDVQFGKGNPPGSFVMLGMAPISPGGIATIPLLAAKGIAPGT